MSFSIYIVEDHPVMRGEIVALIQRYPEFEICGSATTASQAMDEVPERRPNLVVIDIALPDGSGIDLAKQLRSILPGQHVLFLSAFDEMTYAERALKAGGMGYIMKSDASEHLIHAIRSVSNGDLYVSKKIRDRIIERRVRGQSSEEDSLRELTDRELEIYRMIGSGKSLQDISEALHISPKTVDTHRAAIKSKLGCASANDVLQHAIAWYRQSWHGDDAPA